MKVIYLNAIVECDNCGAEYFLSRRFAPKLPNIHRVCNTCFLPMETPNPFYNNQQEAK